MLMNRAETLLINSPMRAASQRWIETPILRRLGAALNGQSVLEIGCGRGVGTGLLLDQLNARSVYAIDLDPAQVERAKRRLVSRRQVDKVDVEVGDATALRAIDASMDAVMDGGVFHHVPRWQDAVAESARVLRPGGLFVFEEVTAHALNRWTYRALFDHPKENRFSGEEFTHEIEQHGLRLLNRPCELFFGDFILGVAIKDG